MRRLVVLRSVEMFKEIVARCLGNERLVGWMCAPVRTARRVFGIQPEWRPLERCRRILVIRPDEIGDVVLTSAFLRELRAAAPRAEISLCVKPACVPLVELCPYVDRVWSLPFRVVLQPKERAPLVWAVLKRKLANIGRGFDAVFLPRVDADACSAELAAHLLTGSGSVVMNSASFISWSVALPRSEPLADRHHLIRQPQHEVLSNSEFLESCGAKPVRDYLEFWFSQDDTKAAESWLSSNSVSGRSIVFHPPGGHSVLRRWPAGKSRELAEAMAAQTEAVVVVVGGPADGWLRDEFSGLDRDKIKIALNTFTLRQLGALIKSCGYFVGGDSGPMHVAASVGAKVVGIFGPGSEIRFKPWSPKSRVVSLRYRCAPDSRFTFEACCQSCIYSENKCLTELSVEKVMAATKEMLAEA